MKISSAFLIIFTITIFIAFPSHVLPETAQEAVSESGRSGQITIRHSDTFYLDNKKETAFFSGDVDAIFLSGEVKTRWDNMTVLCDKLEVIYEKTGKTGKTKDIQASIASIVNIVASGNVRINKPEDNEYSSVSVTCEKAEFYQLEEKIDLTGNPIVKYGDNIFQGTKLTLELKTEKITGDDVNAILVSGENR